VRGCAARQAIPPGARATLASGNPDPRLLPSLAEVLASIDPAHRLYGVAPKLPELAALAADEFGTDDRRPSPAARSTRSSARCRPSCGPATGSVVEDPSWPRIADLVQRASGSWPRPVAGRRPPGLDPEGLARALRGGAAAAVIVTPRRAEPDRGGDRSRARRRAPRGSWTSTPTCW